MNSNKQLKVLLIDDDVHCLDALQNALAPFDDVDIVGTLQDGTQAISFLRRTAVDAVFLDIEMDSIDGFALAKHIQAHYPKVQVIFQTGHTGYAVDGYEFQPADFLVKPIDPLKVERALTHVRNKMTPDFSQHGAQIGIRTGSGLTILNVDDIIFIEKSGRKVYIVCRGDEHVLTNYSLQNLQSIFLDYGFIRCHQSYLVPLNHIRRIITDEFNRRSYNIQVDGTERNIPLSRDRFDALQSILQQRGIPIY